MKEAMKGRVLFREDSPRAHPTPMGFRESDVQAEAVVSLAPQFRERLSFAGNPSRVKRESGR
jgi:hypothetical protein